MTMARLVYPASMGKASTQVVAALASSDQSWGAYLLGQQQIDRDWYAGLRLDYTKDPNNENAEAYGFSTDIGAEA